MKKKIERIIKRKRNERDGKYNNHQIKLNFTHKVQIIPYIGRINNSSK